MTDDSWICFAGILYEFNVTQLYPVQYTNIVGVFCYIFLVYHLGLLIGVCFAFIGDISLAIHTAKTHTIHENTGNRMLVRLRSSLSCLVFLI